MVEDLAPSKATPARSAVRAGALLISHLRYVVVSIRPKQWTKNGIVFLGLIFSVNQSWRPEEFSTWDSLLLRAVLTAALFCLVSGADYLVNDVRDRGSDRLHPRKSRRPIAAGLLAPEAAIAWALVLAASGRGLALPVAWPGRGGGWG